MATFDASRGGIVNISGSIGGVEISGSIPVDLGGEDGGGTQTTTQVASAQQWDTKTIVIGLVVVAVIILVAK